MMWCEHCHKALNDFSQAKVEDEHGYVFNISICPVCRNEVYQEAGTCVMCGEPVGPHENLCDLCADDIGSAIKAIANRREVDTEAVKDGISEYLNMEE